MKIFFENLWIELQRLTIVTASFTFVGVVAVPIYILGTDANHFTDLLFLVLGYWMLFNILYATVKRIKGKDNED